MDILRLILLVLHVVAAALWIGPTLGVTKTLAASIPLGRDAIGLALRDFRLRGGIATIGGIGVLATGLTLFFRGGGFAVYPPQYHAALALTLLGIVNSLPLRGLAAKIGVAAERGDEASKSAALAAVKRMSIHGHISNGLWLGTLVCMSIGR